jgi:alpha 1,3-glucosidase
VPPGDSQSQASLGYYQKIKRLLQSKQQDDEKDQIDPYYKGCEPFFTATLLNRSNKSYYPRHTSSSSLPEDADIVQERLDLFLYLHQDGVARMRITEQYTPPDTAADNSNGNSNSKGTSNNDGNSNGNSDGDKPNNSNPYSKARWTSDELILNHEEIQGVDGDQVKILPFGEIKPLLEHIPANDNDMVTEDNYIAFEYGNLVGGIGGGDDKNKDNDGHMNAILLVQFQPFAIHMWRTNVDGGDSNHAVLDAPIISFNSEQMMHFEVRRDKHDADTDTDMHESHADEDHQGGDGEGGDENDVDTNEDPQPQHEKDKHGGKEIVGYWEDGLAIYADGSREEKIVNSNDASLPKTEAPTDGFQVDTNGIWEEKFGDHHDSKPHGPTSIGADITFPSSTYLYGLPEHASSMQLKDTIGDNAHYKEPYRLYNLDVFEYELDESMALYGEVPLIISQSATAGTAGVFWFNPTETFVDVETSKVGKKGTKTHWISESGIIDLFFLPGPDPRTIYEQYARLTGRMELPPMFSLGYHQCRWNYRDEDDVYQVHEKFEELDYPYDVLWLDIEHTDDKRYFTWDNNQFPNPIAMQDKLSGQGRKMVTIIDPHIKRDDRYYIHKEATAKGLYIKDKSGKKDYDGWCWPGSSSYLDFTSEKVRSWWADQFAYNRYSGSTPSLYTWNDMNEPSVFNGPEVSMQKDLKNLEGVEHREWHNLYGILFQKATAEGLIRRNKGENIRPFVLSRSFYASSQRYGAIWTGDNESSWEHLKIAAPMLLSLNIAALSFVGADVGGFFGNPDAELMTRWMQAGAYQPFFRGHAHHDAKRREPWMFGNEWMVRMRRAAMARYALLPYWYTVFREASVTGMPVMR